MLQNATLLVLGLTFSTLFLGGSAHADTLSVSPTNVEVAQGRSQTSMTIKAKGRKGSVVQIRVFGWKENHSASRLSNTRDVAISPPMARLNGRQELTVRIVRTAKRKLRRRECYRVLVDRLPDANTKQGVIGLRIRHSVPVCFGA